MSTIDRLWQRIQNAFGFGVTTAPANDSGPVQTVQMSLFGIETHDNAPVLYHYGFSSNPPVGSNVAVSFVAGERTNGVVLATGHKQSRPTGLQPGEVVVYDVFGNTIKFTATGMTMTDCNGNIIQMMPGKIHVTTPILECTGDIIDNVGTQPRTMAGMRAVYNGHTHGGIQAGSNHTAIPDQLE